jgi:hypothetical protein
MRRENFTHGLMRHFALVGDGVGLIILAPFFFVLALGRWIVMRVARIPKWPQAIEDTCQINPDVPWQPDAPPLETVEVIPVWDHATSRAPIKTP